MKHLSFLAIFFAGYFWQSGYTPNKVPALRHKFMVIAHRGDHLLYPENTLAAYEQAIRNGADYVEIDLRTTKDGKLVSMHDASVNRMTDGTGPVSEFAFEDIQKLKVKAKSIPDETAYHVPEFEQILALCKNKIYIYIDFKDADPAIVYPIIKRYGMQDQVLVYINKPEQFIAWRKAAPKMPLMVSLPDSVKTAASMKLFIDQYKPDVLDGDYSQYDATMLALAKNYDLPMWPDGQSALEGAEVWDKAIAKGLKGLQTDHPEAFIKYLLAKGLR